MATQQTPATLAADLARRGGAKHPSQAERTAAVKRVQAHAGVPSQPVQTRAMIPMMGAGPQMGGQMPRPPMGGPPTAGQTQTLTQLVQIMHALMGNGGQDSAWGDMEAPKPAMNNPWDVSPWTNYGR